MPKQVQLRGAIEATQEARTLVSREADINTTDNRLNIHDGSTVGGIPHTTCFDQQNQEFNYAAASGTNAITMTLAKAPSSYQTGQKFVFKAASTNTGSVTLNVNSLGAKTVKKKNVSEGNLAALEEGEVIQGGIYAVYYDGTDMVLESVDSGGASWTYVDVSLSSGVSSLELVTGLPENVSEIEILLADVQPSSSGSTGYLAIEVGDSGGYETSGYECTIMSASDSGSYSTGSAGDAAVQQHFDSFHVLYGLGVTTGMDCSGIIRLQRFSEALNHWHCDSSMRLRNSSADGLYIQNGEKIVSSALDRIRLIREDGSFLFVGGSTPEITVRYR